MEIEHKEYSSSSSSSSIDIVFSSTHKKKAGRKIFRETRHPIYRGVRQKSAGKWVCEVREPNKKSRIWLGTFPDPESAAVAHDVAALALRGDNAPLNFPDSATCLPRAKTASHHDIQIAAVQAARDFKPSSSSSSFNAWQPKTSSSSIRFSGNKKKTKTLVSKPSSAISSKKKGVSEIVDNVVEVKSDHGQEMDLEGFNELGFVDEEELFNMPVLIDSMAEGMLLTPPAMKKGFNWSHEVLEGDELGMSLWGE